jgi:spore germination cell wall hydrolase CwlJ-like protein
MGALALAFAAFLVTLVPASADALDCLARNIYYEARGETEQGQLAVAWVTMNRVASRDYPRTVCGVVYDTRHGIQFSWTVARNRAPHGADWQQAQRIARGVLNGTIARSGVWANEDILFYHAAHVRGRTRAWFENNLDRVTQVGAHIFYAAP